MFYVRKLQFLTTTTCWVLADGLCRFDTIHCHSYFVADPMKSSTIPHNLIISSLKHSSLRAMNVFVTFHYTAQHLFLCTKKTEVTKWREWKICWIVDEWQLTIPTKITILDLGQNTGLCLLPFRHSAHCIFTAKPKNRQ